MTCFYLNKAFGMHEFVRVNILFYTMILYKIIFKYPLLIPIKWCRNGHYAFFLSKHGLKKITVKLICHLVLLCIFL